MQAVQRNQRNGEEDLAGVITCEGSDKYSL